VLAGHAKSAFIVAATALALAATILVMPLVLALVPHPIGPAAHQFEAGTIVTITLTLVSGSIGLVLGVVFGVWKTSSSLALSYVARFYIWIIRGTPLVVQILAVYFVLPVALPWINLSDFWSAVIALSMNVAAYNAEIVRGGISAVSRGQIEAGHALGFHGLKRFLLIVFPQAIRICYPSLINNWVSLIKDSSLAYVIGVVELSMVSTRVQSQSFQPVPVFVTTACIYLVLTTIASLAADQIEKQMETPK
jgi:polar amino acid transport system permease protein